MGKIAAIDEMLAMFKEMNVSYISIEEAWEKSEYVEPLLGYLMAQFPQTSAFEKVCKFLKEFETEFLAVSPAIQVVLDAAHTESAAERNRAATSIVDLRNRALLSEKPMEAAFADAVSHVLEMWADPSNEVGGNNSFHRGIASIQALVSAVQFYEGCSEEDEDGRRRAKIRIREVFRRTVPKPP